MVTITGASGKTGSKTAELLLGRGESVRVVGRSAEHLSNLTAKGAEAAIGDQSDVAFLTTALTGADAAYLLIPPKFDVQDVRRHYNEMGDALVAAVKASGVKRVVFLSSLGAERDSDTGPVLGLHDVEGKLATLKDVNIVFLRPGYFMENTMMNIALIKSQGINGNTTVPDAAILMVAARDIAHKAADLLAKRDFTGHSVVDLFGDRISYKQATTAIGKGIGKPDLPYVQFPDGEAIKSMMGMGLSRSLAESFVDLSHGLSMGKVTATMADPLHPNAPTTFDVFVQEQFAPAYQHS